MRPRNVLLYLLICAGVFALIPACVYLAEANALATVVADGAPAVVTAPVPNTADSGSTVLLWLALGLAALSGIETMLKGFRALLAVIAPRTKTTIDDSVLGVVTKLQEDVTQLREALIGAAPGTPLLRKPPAGGGTTMLSLMLAIGVGVAATQSGCTGARARGSVAAGAFIDCQAPNVAGVLGELVPLAKQAVMVAIGGTGDVDLGQLRAAAAPLKSNLGRCALAAAIAALSTPVAPDPDAPASSPLEVDGPQLRAAFARVRGELGWAPVVVGDGTVL